MKTLALLLALSLPTAACVVGEEGQPGTGDGTGDGDGDGDGNGDGTGDGTGTPSTITADTTWTGTFTVDKNLTIAPGVTVTVDPGTAITFNPNTSITVNGTFRAIGTQAAPINIATGAGQFYIGFSVPTGGVLDYAWVNQSGGGIRTSGGTATIVDTYMSAANGDFLVMSGGTVNISYSQIGREVGQVDTTHCNMHFDGAMPNNITVTRSNISTTPYGLMFYSGTGANFTFNNWFDNEIDVATSPGVTGDFSGSWFDGTPPPVTGSGGATLTLDALSATRIVEAGPGAPRAP